MTELQKFNTPKVNNGVPTLQFKGREVKATPMMNTQQAASKQPFKNLRRVQAD